MSKMLLFILLLVICTSCIHHKGNDLKTILIDGGFDEEEVQTFNGLVKEVITGDSNKLHRFSHIYIDRNGNMLKANAKFVSANDTMYRKVTYQTLYNKTGKKTEMKVSYWVYPESCGCSGVLIWKFDSKGRLIKSYPGNYKFGYVTEYKYDTIGRVSYKNVWGKKDAPDKYIYKYDADNHLVQIEAYEMSWHDEKPPEALRSTSFKYLGFDSHNNWIKMIEDADTITRQITYY